MARQRLQTFAEDIKFATKGIAPEAINAELAKFAKAELASYIGSGEGSPIYERFVNDVPGAPEESVSAPGPILYLFSWWPEIIEFALEFLIARSPERSGRYKQSWFVMVNGAERVTEFADIPVDATVTVTNDQPYSRKIEVGHMTMSVPPGVVEDGKQAVQHQYGAIIDVRKTMMLLAGGYVLKGHFTKGARKFSRTRLQRDTMAGQQETYPALVLKMKGF